MPRDDLSRERVIEPNGDGTFRITAAGHRIMMAALKRSTKILYHCKPATLRNLEADEERGSR